jgi:hypothetical protein
MTLWYSYIDALIAYVGIERPHSTMQLLVLQQQQIAQQKQKIRSQSQMFMVHEICMLFICVCCKKAVSLMRRRVHLYVKWILQPALLLL